MFLRLASRSVLKYSIFVKNVLHLLLCCYLNTLYNGLYVFGAKKMVLNIYVFYDRMLYHFI